MSLSVNLNSGPVRTRPFEASCRLSGNEIELVTECLESNNWSSFKGATEGWNLNDCATMPSSAAAEYGSTEIRFLGGRFVRQLEAAVAKDTQTEYGVSANSATSALIMALGALDLGPGDEVLVPCLSFNASATAILFFNSIPVFCEIKPDTLCIDPKDIEAKITSKTKAIMVVHFSGNAADMDSIMQIAMKHGLKVIEDCAQAPGGSYKGRPLGSIGDAGVFSFTETKTISCGEGGMLVTNEPNVAKKSRLIRNHGEGMTEVDWSDDDLANIIGMNFRLTEIQAAVAVPQWQSLPVRNAARNKNWQYLKEGLADYRSELVPLSLEEGTEMACYFGYWRWNPNPGRPSRAELIAEMQKLGVPIGIGFPNLMHENPIYVRRIAYGKSGCPWSCHPPSETVTSTYGTGGCPKSETINEELISFKYVNLPNTEKDMDDVIAAFRRILD